MPTRQAFSVEMVGREDIGNAVALNSAMFNGARVLGPAVAGLTIGAFGVSIAFLIDAISFLAVLIVAARDARQRAADRRRRSRARRPSAAWSGISREGLCYVRRTPIVLLGDLDRRARGDVRHELQVVIPPLAEDVLHSDATGYGFLMAASGLGSLVAALTSPSRRGPGRPHRRRRDPARASPRSPSGCRATFYLSLGLMFLVGLGAIAMAATANTTIQLAVPDHLRGRAMSVYTTVFAGSTPVGGLLMGWIASKLRRRRVDGPGRDRVRRSWASRRSPGSAGAAPAC